MSSKAADPRGSDSSSTSAVSTCSVRLSSAGTDCSNWLILAWSCDIGGVIGQNGPVDIKSLGDKTLLFIKFSQRQRGKRVMTVSSDRECRWFRIPAQRHLPHQKQYHPRSDHRYPLPARSSTFSSQTAGAEGAAAGGSFDGIILLEFFQLRLALNILWPEIEKRHVGPDCRAFITGFDIQACQQLLGGRILGRSRCHLFQDRAGFLMTVRWHCRPWPGRAVQPDNRGVSQHPDVRYGGHRRPGPP